MNNVINWWNVNVLQNYPNIGSFLTISLLIVFLLCVVNFYKYKIDSYTIKKNLRNFKKREDSNPEIINRKWKRNNIFFAIIAVFVLIVIIYFTGNPLSDLQKFGNFTTLVGIGASILIYRHQLSLSHKTDNVLNEIDKNILDLQSIKSDQDLKETIQNWFNNNVELDMVLFYFPFTLCPGFWNYVDEINEDLKKLLDDYKKIKWILIGPKSSPQNNITSNIIDYISKNFNKIPEGHFKKKIQDLLDDKLSEMKENGEDITKIREEKKSEILKQIATKKYNDAVGDVITIKSDHHRFLTHELPPADNNLFSFSFVLKFNNKRAQEILILDTFDFFTSDLTKKKNLIGNISIIENIRSNSPESINYLFKRPRSFLIKNQDMANFIFSMFLESCYKYNDLNKFLEDNLYDKNK